MRLIGLPVCIADSIVPLLKNTPSFTIFLASVLSQLCDEHLAITHREMLNLMHPGNIAGYTEHAKEDYWKTACRILIGRIALAKRTDFPKLTLPRAFRTFEKAA